MESFPKYFSRIWDKYVVRRKMPASAFLLINLAVSDLFLLMNAPMKIVLQLELNMFSHLGSRETRPFLCKDFVQHFPALFRHF